MSNVAPDSFVKQVQDTERALVGAVLQDPSVASTFNALVLSEYFSDTRHQAVWTAILDLELDGKPIDLLTVFTQIQETGGDVKTSYLAEIHGSAPVTQNASFYADQFLKNYSKIKTIRILQTHLGLGSLVDPQRVQADLESLSDMLNFSSEEDFMEWGDVGKRLVEKLRNGEPMLEGHLPQDSFPALNEKAPLHKGELCIVGAIESGGKTAFAVNLCLGLARKGSRGMYFFYESTAENLQLRIASIMTRIPLNQIKMRDLTEHQIGMVEENMLLMKDELVYRDESQKGAIDDLIGHVKSRIKKHPCDFIVIDHMHQMPIAGKMREGFIDISRKFLQLAKQENICVIALAQFRKPTEREFDKRPNRGMIRESSSIAQDAHHIWFLHDPAYLEAKRAEQKSGSDQLNEYSKRFKSRGGQDDAGDDSPKHAEIIIDKNREGTTDVILAEFRRDCVLWKEL